MGPRLPSPFGVPWESLDLHAVSTFLTRREDESLTWEAKGGDIRPDHVRNAASAFGNSVLGGLLLLGATQNRSTHEWSVDGWVPPESEVDLWVNNCLDRGGVTPRPSVEVKAWPLDGGGILACAGIWPVAVPPAITSAGQVWERTSGKSQKVIDPTDLRWLFDRGEAARSRAEQRANEAANELYAMQNADVPLGFVLGFAAASLPSEMSAQIFRQSFLESLSEAAKRMHRRHMAENLAHLVRTNPDWNQAGITFRSTDGFSSSEGYSLRAGRDGRVAVGFGHPGMETVSTPQTYSGTLQTMWAEAKSVLDRLGALGPIHVAGRFSTSLGVTAAASWSDMSSEGGEELASMLRDVQRALGQEGWEPEEPASD